MTTKVLSKEELATAFEKVQAIVKTDFVSDGNKRKVGKDTEAKVLEVFGVDLDTAKTVDQARGVYATALFKEFKTDAVNVMAGNAEVDEIKGKFKTSFGSIQMNDSDTKEIRNPGTGDISTENGHVRVKYEVDLFKTSGGLMEETMADMAAYALKQYKK
jgi:hypothetical protein